MIELFLCTIIGVLLIAGAVYIFAPASNAKSEERRRYNKKLNEEEWKK